jgi:methyltransferase-like protein
MSHYNDFETEMKDKDALIRALCRCKNRHNQSIQREWIETHNNPDNLFGYLDDQRSQKANIIIRRQHVGPSSNDLGFVQTDTGYKAIISDYDSHYYNPQWIGKLTTYYNIEKSKMELEAKGIAYTEVLDEIGRIQLRAKFKTETETTSRIQVRR